MGGMTNLDDMMSIFSDSNFCLLLLSVNHPNCHILIGDISSHDNYIYIYILWLGMLTVKPLSYFEYLDINDMI